MPIIRRALKDSDDGLMTNGNGITNGKGAKKPDKRHATRTSWQPGQSGNPAGAPKRGQSWREIIDEIGDEIVQRGPHKGETYKRAVASAMYKVAARNNTSAAAWLARYGGGTTELSELSTDQLRALIATRFGIALDSTQQGSDSISDDAPALESPPIPSPAVG